MADETVATDEQAAEQTVAPEETASAEPKTALDFVKEETARVDGAAEAENPPPKKGQTVNERISTYATRAKDAEAKATEAEKRAETIETALQSEVQALKAEIARINQLVVSGQITRPEAAAAKATAGDDFEAAIEALEVPDELLPFKTDLAHIARKMADAVIAAKLGPIEERLKAEDIRRTAEAKERAEAETAEFRKEMHSNYKAVAQKFPALFITDEETGLPDLKPEYQERAMEIVSQYNQPVEGGYYNPMLATKEGLTMLMRELSQPIEAAEKAKAEIEKTNSDVATAKKNRVELPQGARPGASVGQKSILELTRETMQEIQ